MKPSVSITGEHQAHKVAAIFETESDANGVAQTLSQDTSLDDEQVIVVTPTTNIKVKRWSPRIRVYGIRCYARTSGWALVAQSQVLFCS